MGTEIATYADLADNINSRMRDENLRKLIFDARDVEEDDLQIIGQIKRIAEIAYLIIYLKWVKCRAGLNKSTLTPHCRNVFGLLERVYVGERLCLDVVAYTLTEAKRDVMQYGSDSFFADVLTGYDCPYARIYDLVYNWTNSFDFCDNTPRVIFNSTLSVLESVGWFASVELIEADGEVSLKVAGNVYRCGDYFCKIERGYYLLESYELVADNTVRCKYARLGGSGGAGDIFEIDKKKDKR